MSNKKQFSYKLNLRHIDMSSRFGSYNELACDDVKVSQQRNDHVYYISLCNI